MTALASGNPGSGSKFGGGRTKTPVTSVNAVGVAQIKALGIHELLDHGQLIDLFRDWPDERFRLYALYPSRHLPAAKVRAFIDFVMAAVGPKSGRPL
jgi:DNA-binding transcriptional LysR family regulator